MLTGLPNLANLSLVLLLADLGLVGAVAVHILLNKHDPRAIIGWLAVCLLTPFIGALLYFVFGINRVQTRAQRLAARSPFTTGESPLDLSHEIDGEHASELLPLARIAGRITGRPLLAGNRVDCLHDGEQAYPAMLAAMAQARETLFLASYIFDTGATGQRFIAALAAAVRRGVDVRVLIDGVGQLSSRPRASRMLRDCGVPVARFIPPRLVPPQFSINLRNHRKLLVVDGREGYTGGMNISHDHLAADQTNPKRITDLHFRLQGPIVGAMQQTFLEDWGFITEDRTPVSATPAQREGEACCRTIVDGPNEDLDQMIRVLTAVICAARHRIGIMTPYFLPPNGLLTALRAAALRGVEVTVLLPGQPDHAFVQWASTNVIGLLLHDGAQVAYRPPPFAHSKLLLIDDTYVLLGSANLDPRSLRLNFELGVEVFDPGLSGELWCHFEEARARARPLTEADLTGRSLPVRLRDALAWACSPYL
ncbi:MAG: cardiolipin synthase [Candidatus Competibacterales bacterium]|nr:cardiolipin synthase [Candidatus Competibacterales bacterium]